MIRLYGKDGRLVSPNLVLRRIQTRQKDDYFEDYPNLSNSTVGARSGDDQEE